MTIPIAIKGAKCRNCGEVLSWLVPVLEPGHDHARLMIMGTCQACGAKASQMVVFSRSGMTDYKIEQLMEVQSSIAKDVQCMAKQIERLFPRARKRWEQEQEINFEKEDG